MNDAVRTFIWRVYMINFFKNIKPPYFFYGAGQHTDILLTLLENKKLQLPLCIIDAEPKKEFMHGIPCSNLSEMNFTDKPSFIVLSSDVKAVRGKMAESLKPLNIPGNIEIIDIYIGLPDGPYVKTY